MGPADGAEHEQGGGVDGQQRQQGGDGQSVGQRLSCGVHRLFCAVVGPQALLNQVGVPAVVGAPAVHSQPQGGNELLHGGGLGHISDGLIVIQVDAGEFFKLVLAHLGQDGGEGEGSAVAAEAPLAQGHAGHQVGGADDGEQPPAGPGGGGAVGSGKNVGVEVVAVNPGGHSLGQQVAGGPGAAVPGHPQLYLPGELIQVLQPGDIVLQLGLDRLGRGGEAGVVAAGAHVEVVRPLSAVAAAPQHNGHHHVLTDLLAGKAVGHLGGGVGQGGVVAAELRVAEAHVGEEPLEVEGPAQVVLGQFLGI